MTEQVGTIRSVERQRIRDILAEELELQPDELDDDADFVDQYEADSLSLITLVGRIESELGIRVPDSEWNRMTNLSQVFTVVDEFSGNEHARS